jgi:hypothetical protein
LSAHDNARLSAWQREHLLLTSCARERPWEIESEVIDLLGGELPRAIPRRLHEIARRIQRLSACVVLNTVYDPTPSTTRATATTTSDGASWVCRGWRRL